MNPFGRSLFIMVLIHFFGSPSLTLRQVCIVFLTVLLIFLCSVMVPVEVEEGGECCSLLSPLHFLCTLASMLTTIGVATLPKFFTPQMWHLPFWMSASQAKWNHPVNECILFLWSLLVSPKKIGSPPFSSYKPWQKQMNTWIWWLNLSWQVRKASNRLQSDKQQWLTLFY